MSQPQSETVTKPQPASHQPPGQQHLLAEQVGCPPHVVPLLHFLVIEQPAGVITGDDARVFPGKIERVGHAPADHIERLLLETIGAGQGPLGIQVAAERIELGQQMPAILEPVGGDPQLHVPLDLAAAAGVERPVGRAQLAGACQGGQSARLEIAL
jgi:hypothetical protein